MARFMNIKQVGGGLLIFSTVILLTWLVMPMERTAQLEESIHRLRNDPGILCLDYERLSLSDPKAAKLNDVTELNGENIVKIKYSAKNAYGAYVSTSAVCSLKDGKIDLMSTENARTLDQLNKHNACLEAKLKGQENRIANNQVRYEKCIEGLMPLK